MVKRTATYEDLEQAFIAWAQTQESIRSAIVVGSRARETHGADQWSDLDLVVFAADVQPFVADSAWLGALGEVWLVVPNRTGRGDPEWLVLFDGGLKVDFVFVVAPDASQPLALLLESSSYHFVYQRGMRRLFDKNDPEETHPLPVFTPPAPSPPSPQEFANLIQQFLLNVTRCARFIRRGDLWRAKFMCDHVLKQQLLTMLEWHILAMRGLAIDVWHDGRFLSEWADARALASLPHTFAAYDARDLRRALLATLDLFRWLAQETAARWGYPYPQEVESKISDWLQEVLPA